MGLEESGFSGETDDYIATGAPDSTGGYTPVLAAMKALLEHKIVLSVAVDRFP